MSLGARYVEKTRKTQKYWQNGINEEIDKETRRRYVEEQRKMATGYRKVQKFISRYMYNSIKNKHFPTYGNFLRLTSGVYVQCMWCVWINARAHAAVRATRCGPVT